MTKETLQKAASALHSELPDVGFIVIVMPFGDGSQGQANYISNCQREDAVAILKTLLFRWGKEEAWMQDVT